MIVAFCVKSPFALIDLVFVNSYELDVFTV